MGRAGKRRKTATGVASGGRRRDHRGRRPDRPDAGVHSVTSSALATSALVLPSANRRSASRSFRMICSGECFLPFNWFLLPDGRAVRKLISGGPVSGGHANRGVLLQGPLVC